MKKTISFCLLFIFCGIINVSAATTYKVNYVLLGGTNNKKNIVEYSSLKENFVLLSPSRAGYTFDGWYTDKALTKKVENIPKGSTGNKTYYAKWIVNTYSIKFSGNSAQSGSMARRNNLRYDKNYILAANTFVRKGYKFTGWNTNAKGTGKTYLDKATVGQVSKVNGGVVTLYAQWQIVNYGITYNLNGGTNNKNNPKTYNVETEVVYNNPTKTGYTFDGWYSDAEFTKKVEKISKGSAGNKSLYAKWIVNTYTIKYSGNGAESGSMPRRTNLRYDKNYILNENTFKRTGYKFNGWNTNANGTGKTYADKATVGQVSKVNGGVVTLYAKWKIVNYAINYNLAGGENNPNNPSTYNIESVITLKNPTRKGYKFYGWYSDSTFKNKVTKIENSVGVKNLYAKWTIINYTITYNLNGGENNFDNPTSYNVEDQINLKNATKENYSFAGWYTNEECTNKITSISKGSVGNKNLYAKWLIRAPIKGKDFEVDTSEYSKVNFIFNKELDYKYMGYNTNVELYYGDTNGLNYVAAGSTSLSNTSDMSFSGVNPGQNYYFKLRLNTFDSEKNKYSYSEYSLPIETHTIASPMTNEQRALERLKIYVNFGGYSKEGIRSYLSYDFIPSEINYAFDNYSVNWNEQAIIRANLLLKEYHSRREITDHLRGLQFTSEEIEYALMHLEIDWFEQAVIYATESMQDFNYSKNMLVNHLIAVDFYHDEAVHGAEHCGKDWKEEALNTTNAILQQYPNSRYEIISYLRYYEYNDEEISYALNNCTADWYLSAVDTAKKLIIEKNYTRDGLIFDLIVLYRFTEEEANYGADNCGKNW